MCGFLAVAGDLAKDVELSRLASRTLGRRGPDRLRTDAAPLGPVPIRLAHAQFDVMDREASESQPLRSSSGNSLIVFNGEIYNFLELAKEMDPPAQGWRTNTDTEVLLEGLERWGVDFLHRTNGMFAFLFLRLDRPEAILARDRLGIKPLYWSENGDGWAAGSTLRSVLATGVVPFEVSAGGLDTFLAFGSPYEPRTIARHVRAVPPGALIRWTPGGTWCEHVWWRLPDPSSELTTSEAAEESQELLADAVRLRMRSIHPMGLFLSGGTDSTSLALRMAESSSVTFSTFSLAFQGDDSAFSEASYQRRAASLCGSRHHECVITHREGLDALEDFVSVMDQPTMDGFNVYLVAREAARAGARTCLSGVGGDEVFAGYKTFGSVDRYQALIGALGLLPGSLRSALAHPLRALADSRLETRLGKAADLLADVRSLDDYYALRRSLFSPRQLARLRGTKPARAADWLSASPGTGSDLVTAWSSYELGNYVRNTLLRDSDCFGMAHPVEIRVPYLDHRLVELAFRVRGETKVSAETHKPLLQAAMAGALPRFTWQRRKTGFDLPMQEWLRKRLLPEPDLSGHLDRSEVDRVTQAFHRNPGNRRSWTRLWSLVVLERYLASLRP